CRSRPAISRWRSSPSRRRRSISPRRAGAAAPPSFFFARRPQHSPRSRPAPPSRSSISAACTMPRAASRSSTISISTKPIVRRSAVGASAGCPPGRAPCRRRAPCPRSSGSSREASRETRAEARLTQSLLLTGLLGGWLAADATAFFQLLLSQPLVGGALAGAVWGDATSGMQVGALLQLFALAGLPLGGRTPEDYASAGVVGPSVALYLRHELATASFAAPLVCGTAAGLVAALVGR